MPMVQRHGKQLCFDMVEYYKIYMYYSTICARDDEISTPTSSCSPARLDEREPLHLNTSQRHSLISILLMHVSASHTCLYKSLPHRIRKIPLGSWTYLIWQDARLAPLPTSPNNSPKESRNAFKSTDGVEESPRPSLNVIWQTKYRFLNLNPPIQKRVENTCLPCRFPILHAIALLCGYFLSTYIEKH